MEIFIGKAYEALRTMQVNEQVQGCQLVTNT